MSPSANLDVNGTAVIRGHFEINKTGGSKITHFNWGSNGDIYLRSSETAGKIILQDDGGNVGIGTGSPDAKLEVSGDLNIAATTDGWNTSVGKGLYLRFYDGHDTGYIQCIDRSNNDTQYKLKYMASHHEFSTRASGQTWIL